MTSTSRPIARGLIVGPLAALALLIGLSALAAPAQAAFPGKNGKIAFSSDRSGTQDIWTMDADGSGHALVQSDGTEDFFLPYPTWSSDGREIAFTREHRPFNHQEDIFVMQADGGNLRQVTDMVPTSALGPTWSPDGGRIAFWGDGSIYVTAFPASGEAPVSIVSYGENYNHSPDWSPDGGLIAFATFLAVYGADTYDHIQVVDPNGAQSRALTTGAAGAIEGDPSISPDGQTVVFWRDAHGRTDLYTVPIGGGTPALLTDTPTFDEFEPVWSPDGTKIAFAGKQQEAGAHFDVYTINADGTGRKQLTSNPGDDRQPDWQPVNRPPDCSKVVASPNDLSPADRSLHLVGLSGASDPDGNTVSLEITAVTQDEPLTGDGDDTGQDAFSKYFASDPYVASLLGNKANEVYLRAESRKHGDGRVYRIAFTGSDGKGRTCSETTSVRVPSPKGLTVDSAPPSYNSFGP